jgi:hypothetical protein
MDETFAKLFHESGSGGQTLEINPEAGTVAMVDTDGKAGEPYAVKPIGELYGNGTGQQSVDLTDETFLPLLIGIEQEFVTTYRRDDSLTDSAVIASLDKLCMSPEADTRSDPVANRVQFALRLSLSLNNYSRQDVRLCLRKIKQSVIQHNKIAGTRGYLRFIDQTLP